MKQSLTLRPEARQLLSRELLRGIGMMGMSGSEIAETLTAAAAENPCLRLRPSRTRAGEAAEEVAADGPSLMAHVLGQLPRLVPVRADATVALALAEALDAQGFVGTPLHEIAARLQLPEPRVAAVLAQLQRIEPRGLFARSLAECLALQLDRIEPPMRRLLDALPLLAEVGPEALARAAELTPAQLSRGLAQLRELDPRPAAGFSHTPARPRVADLTFTPGTNGWSATLNPELSLRPTLAEAPSSAQLRAEARSLLAAIERRNAALLALGAHLAEVQAAFLSHGPAALRPLTRRSVAAALDLHESTVSRLVAANAAATPRGVLPLAAFFARPPHRTEAAAPLAPAAIAARIATLIGAEDPTAPLTDGDLAALLAAEGLAVSRRVVAKLRAAAHLPARAARRRQR